MFDSIDSALKGLKEGKLIMLSTMKTEKMKVILSV